MGLRHIDDPVRRTWRERLMAAQFHLRKNLAKLPYVPVPVRLKVSADEKIDFWWSYIVPYFDPTREFFDYWGHDAGELRFLWKVLRAGMVFFDVGAYHGVYSVVASKRLGASGQVVAFEPSPREYARLRLHFRWNRMRAARAERLAIGSASGDRTFFQVDSGDTTMGSLRPPDTRDELSEVVVSTTSLDHDIAAFPLNRVDIVKIDVEGGELEALKGASALVGKLRPIFICEVLDGATRPWGYEAKEIILAFQKHDFDWYDFRVDGRVVPHIARSHYPEVCNYLAVPREKASEIEQLKEY